MLECHSQGMWNTKVLPSLSFSAWFGNTQDWSKWFWILSFIPWVMFVLCSEWSFCDTRPCLFILTLICEVEPFCFSKLSPSLSSRYISISLLHKKKCCSSSERSELCVPNPIWNFFREVEVAEWKPGQAERSQLLKSHLTLQPSLESPVSFCSGNFENSDRNRALKKTKRKVWKWQSVKRGWLVFPKLVLISVEGAQRQSRGCSAEGIWEQEVGWEQVELGELMSGWRNVQSESVTCDKER